MTNRPTFEYSPPKVMAGNLRIPIHFFSQSVGDSPEPTDIKPKEVFYCLCDAYAPSNKDKVVLDGHDVDLGVTVIIRDTKGEFVPTNKMTARIDDVRYQNVPEWQIEEIRHDFEHNRFVTLVLGVKQ
jgi:hypothetical protein